MKWPLSLTVLCVVVILGQSSCLASPQLSTPANIGVIAQVELQRFIIINDAGRIIKILSNTLKPVPPQVYKHSIQEGNKVPLTAALKNRYNSLITHSKTKVGVVYQADKQPHLFYRVLGILRNHLRSIGAYFWPGLTLVAPVYLFSAFVLGLGVIHLISGRISIERRRTWRVTALVVLVVGLLLIFRNWRK